MIKIYQRSLSNEYSYYRIFPYCYPKINSSCFSRPVHIVTPEKAHPYLADAEAIIPKHVPIDHTILEQAPNLKIIQTGAGYDNVDLATTKAHNVPVCNAAGINANTVAEHALTLILSWYKNISYLDNYMKQNSPTASLTTLAANLLEKVRNYWTRTRWSKIS